MTQLNKQMEKIMNEFDKEFPQWEEPKSGAGKELGVLAGTGMYLQYDADRKHRDEEIKRVKSFLAFSQKKVLEGVVEMCEGMKESGAKDKELVLQERAYNKALSDLQEKIRGIIKEK